MTIPPPASPLQPPSPDECSRMQEVIDSGDRIRVQDGQLQIRDGNQFLCYNIKVRGLKEADPKACYFALKMLKDSNKYDWETGEWTTRFSRFEARTSGRTKIDGQSHARASSETLRQLTENADEVAIQTLKQGGVSAIEQALTESAIQEIREEHSSDDEEEMVEGIEILHATAEATERTKKLIEKLSHHHTHHAHHAGQGATTHHEVGSLGTWPGVMAGVVGGALTAHEIWEQRCLRNEKRNLEHELTMAQGKERRQLERKLHEVEKELEEFSKIDKALSVTSATAAAVRGGAEFAGAEGTIVPVTTGILAGAAMALSAREAYKHRKEQIALENDLALFQGVKQITQDNLAEAGHAADQDLQTKQVHLGALERAPNTPDADLVQVRQEVEAAVREAASSNKAVDTWNQYAAYRDSQSARDIEEAKIGKWRSVALFAIASVSLVATATALAPLSIAALTGSLIIMGVGAAHYTYRHPEIVKAYANRFTSKKWWKAKGSMLGEKVKFQSAKIGHYFKMRGLRKKMEQQRKALILTGGVGIRRETLATQQVMKETIRNWNNRTIEFHKNMNKHRAEYADIDRNIAINVLRDKFSKGMRGENADAFEESMKSFADNLREMVEKERTDGTPGPFSDIVNSWGWEVDDFLDPEANHVRITVEAWIKHSYRNEE